MTNFSRISFNNDRFDLVETTNIKLYVLWDKAKQKQVLVFDGDLVVTGESFCSGLNSSENVLFCEKSQSEKTGIYKL